MKKGFSLVELLVAIGIVAILVGFSIPAINALQKSYDSTGADSMISAALSTARTLAISNHQYAGVRFQMEYNSDPNKANQYMIFTIYDEDKSNLTCGFIAKEGYKPIKLPENVGVIDMMRRASSTDPNNDTGDDVLIKPNDLDNFGRTMTDTTAFSVVFSPTGKLVVHNIRVRNKDGRTKNYTPPSKDDVFNIETQVNSGIGMFIQDDYANLGLGGEKSRKGFVIYDRDKFKTMTTATQRWNYLNGLDVKYVNPYSGQLIEK